MKCYRFEVKKSIFDKFVGPLKGVNFYQTGLTKPRYMELLKELNEKLYTPSPYINYGSFWFTQKGLDKFGPCMRIILNALMTEGNCVVKSARLISAEINIKDSCITFNDSYQVASTESYKIKVVEKF